MSDIRYPFNWQIVSLGDICHINKSSLSEKTSKDYKFKYIDLSSVDEGKIEFPTEDISFDDAPSRARRKINENDIIMSTVRPNLKGFAFIDFDSTNFICSTGFAVLTAKEPVYNRYIYQLLYSKNIETQINNMLVGSNYPAINSSDVASLKIALPPLAEQEKIAGILGTWDEAIEKLSSLIEQKKNLKKGLMQRLLTGKTRLKGFTQPWKEVKLGELIKQKRIVIEKGKSLTSENIVEGAIPVIAGGKTSPYSHNKFTHNKPCITISASGAYAGYVWKHITPIWASDCNVLYGTDYDTNFLGCCLEYKQQQIYQLQTGGAQPHVYATDIKIITVPNINVTEQQAIADVLSTADEEIDLLNKKLEALKEQKKGLMQQLLTGQTRVKVN